MTWKFKTWDEEKAAKESWHRWFALYRLMRWNKIDKTKWHEWFAWRPITIEADGKRQEFGLREFFVAANILQNTLPGEVFAQNFNGTIAVQF